MTVYQEYPKWVFAPDAAEPTLVKDAAEEADVLGKSETEVAEQAAQNTEEGQAAVDASDDKEAEKLREKGNAVSEADVVKLTNSAQDLIVKRGPGRPKKVAEDAPAEEVAVPTIQTAPNDSV